MPTFPSPEWVAAFQDAINANPTFRKAAKDLSADFLFHVQPDGPLSKDAFFYVKIQDGRCAQADPVASRGARAAEFVVAGRYGEWVRVLRGEYDPIQAVLTRRIEVQGNLPKLMRHVSAAKELIQSSRQVETAFL